MDPSTPNPIEPLLWNPLKGTLRAMLFGYTIPVAQKTYLFKKLYIETIIRNPKKVGLFGYRLGHMDPLGKAPKGSSSCAPVALNALCGYEWI